MNTKSNFPWVSNLSLVPAIGRKEQEDCHIRHIICRLPVLVRQGQSTKRKGMWDRGTVNQSYYISITRFTNCL